MAKTMLRNLITQIVQGVPISGPRAVFIGGVDGIWLDPSDLDSLWVDEARTQHPTSPGDVVWWIDDKSPNGNHLAATSSVARGRLYKWPTTAVLSGGIRNLYKASNFNTNSPWPRVGSSRGNGTVTYNGIECYAIVESSGESQHQAQQEITMPAVAGKMVRDGVFHSTNRGIRFGRSTPGAPAAEFNLQTGVATNIDGDDCGMTDLGNGWWYCWVVGDYIPEAVVGLRLNINDETGNPTYLGDGTSRVTVYNSSVYFADAPNPSQQIVGADIWDVSEEGQEDHYGIRFDGVSTHYVSSRGMNSFTNDQMSLMFGVTKFAETGTTTTVMSVYQPADEGSVTIFAPGSGSVSYGYRHRTQTTYLMASLSSGGSDPHDAPDSAILDGWIDGGSIHTVSMQVNNDPPIVATNSLGGAIGTGEFNFGALPSGGNKFDGILWGAVLLNEKPDAKHWQDNVKVWLNGKMGGVIQPFNIFGLIGQSNAQGRVAIAEGPASVSSGVVENVSVWNSTAVVPFDLGNVGPSGHGGSWVSGGNADVYSFAHVGLSSLSSAVSNIVVCQVTQGGTGIYPEPDNGGCWNANYSIIPEGTPKLLQAFEDRLANLMAYLDSRNQMYQVRGVLWHQGEADNAYPEPEKYGERLAGVFNRVRLASGVADLPVFYGTLSHDSSAYNVGIEAGMLSVAASDPNYFCRDNSGLTLQDGLHFDSTSQNTFGDWFDTTFRSTL